MRLRLDARLDGVDHLGVKLVGQSGRVEAGEAHHGGQLLPLEVGRQGGRGVVEEFSCDVGAAWGRADGFKSFQDAEDVGAHLLVREFEGCGAEPSRDGGQGRLVVEPNESEDGFRTG
jgi:hypothetical protein